MDVSKLLPQERTIKDKPNLSSQVLDRDVDTRTRHGTDRKLRPSHVTHMVMSHGTPTLTLTSKRDMAHRRMHNITHR